MKNGKNGLPEPIINIGDVYGRLTISKVLGMRGVSRYVTAKCECGVVAEYRFLNLKNKNTKSCGCLNRELSAQRLFKHGLSHDSLHSVWSGMKERCYNEDNHGFPDYGGRGIGVCDGWGNDFFTFYTWSIANGYKKGLQIDRKDNDGNYEPINCRWVTSKINANNKRNTLYFEYNGFRKSFSEWCDLYGLNYKLSHQRMVRNNMSFETLVKRFKGELKNGME